AGTVLVQDIRPGSAASDPTYLVGMNNKLYFSADDGTRGRELWDPPPVEPPPVVPNDPRFHQQYGLELTEATRAWNFTTGSTIWLDDNAAGWGWFVDPTAWKDTEFTTAGDQHRKDLLTVLAHEVGHLLGYEHEHDSAMQETFSVGERRAPQD